MAPASAPAICAKNCLLGDAPSIEPHLKSCIRSAHWLAAPPVTFAAMRFAATLLGTSMAKTSWVTLPIGPTGVMFVSPETRDPTIASANDMSTPRVAAHQMISNSAIWSATESTSARIAPV